MREIDEDFAILKFETPHELPCAKIAQKPLLPNERVWSPNFPVCQKATRAYVKWNSEEKSKCDVCTKDGMVAGKNMNQKNKKSAYETMSMLGFVKDFQPLVISTETTRMSFQDNAYYKKLQFKPQDIASAEKAHGVPPNIVSDLDSCGGSSGSSYFNFHGELVSLFYEQAFDGAEDTYYSNSTVSIPIQHLKDRVTEIVGPSTAQKIFDCHNN